MPTKRFAMRSGMALILRAVTIIKEHRKYIDVSKETGIYGTA
jgi:hypothetical protein